MVPLWPTGYAGIDAGGGSRPVRRLPFMRFLLSSRSIRVGELPVRRRYRGSFGILQSPATWRGTEQMAGLPTMSLATFEGVRSARPL